jgi:hypothetical protein
MIFGQWIKIFLCFVLAVVFLVGASLLIEPVHKSREAMGLVAVEPLENAPPSLAFATVAMGAFRGLVVDILWIRAEKLKEEGQFFDAKQLAEWITTLQPRFASVWDFQAWNMAYNISVAMPNTRCDERWRWVKNGYELLRDKGIPKNPHSITLYRSLAWIFQHKIGGITDDCHKYYRYQLYQEFEQLLGEEPDVELFERLAEMPLSFDELLQDEEVSKFVYELDSSDTRFGDYEKLCGNYIALRNGSGGFEPEAMDVIDSYRGSETLRKFDLFARAKLLRDDWKYDPGYMASLNERFGPVDPEDPNNVYPLDWGHPHSHAIYWAQLGLDRIGNTGELSVNEKNTDRIVLHSLQELYRTGKIVIYDFEDRRESLFLLPDLRMFDKLNEFWKEAIEKYSGTGFRGPTGLLAGHRNMLVNAVSSFYYAGYKGKAASIHKELISLYPGREEYQVSLFEFVSNRMKEEVSNIGISDVRELLYLVLQDSYMQYALREDRLASAREARAKQIYEIYTSEFSDTFADRVKLPDFKTLRYQSLAAFINNRRINEEIRRNLLARIKVEKPELYEGLMDRFERERQLQEQGGPDL